MRIKQFEYEDKQWDWVLKPVDFSNQRIALLVGLSGVGKTQTLQAIMNLKKIANGSSLNGVKWNVTFCVEDDTECCWEGEFENKKPANQIIGREDQDDIEGYKILYEKLSIGKDIIIERDSNEIKFEGTKTPKLSPFESAIEIFKREENIVPVQKEFRKIAYSDQSLFVNEGVGLQATKFHELIEEYSSIEDIRSVTNLPVELKLALVYKNVIEIFSEIKTHFINIFPQVKDIKIEPISAPDFHLDLVELPIQIREQGVNHWIHQRNISSGMRRVLNHISEIYLLPRGSIVLIDEFENSLGVNCIDTLTETLLSAQDRDIRYIITSHHPYIINNVAPKYWKIVTRQGGVVTVRDASEFNLGKTRHSAFMELMQLEAYTEGITSP